MGEVADYIKVWVKKKRISNSGDHGSDGSGSSQLNGDWAGDNNAGDDGGK